MDLNSSKIFPSGKKLWIYLGFTFVYALLIISFSFYHEIWRDEMRALSIVKASSSIFALMQNLKNEGHPLLWYFILFFGNQIIHSTILLKIASLTIAIVSMLIFMFYSPFSKVEKLFFMVGYFPLYEYSIMCRNYGLGMLLLFWILALIPKKEKNFLRISILLFFLANTSMLAWILTVSIFLYLGVELLLKEGKTTPTLRENIFIGSGIIFMGLFLSAFSMFPDQTTIATPLYDITFHQFIEQLLQSLISHGNIAQEIFAHRFSFPVSGLILILYIYFIRKPSLILFLFSNIMGIELLHRLIYPLAPRHFGFLFLAIISALWIHNFKPYSQHAWKKKTIKIIFIFILFLQIDLGFQKILDDIRYPLSSAKAVGQWIRKNERFKDAIIIGEPEFLAEALPYYIPNSMYIPRENKFKKYTSFTRRNKKNFTLIALLENASLMTRKLEAPILYLDGHRRPKKGTIHFGMNKTFRQGDKGLETLKKCGKLLHKFEDSRSDENFWLYQIQC